VSELVAKLEGCDWLSIIWKENGKLMRKERKKVCLCAVSETINEEHLAQNEQGYQNICTINGYLRFTVIYYFWLFKYLFRN
jgi:hypothetical protein